MSFKYKELHFTKHSLKRLKQRNINLKDAWATWYNPDNSRFSKNKGAWIYYKNIKGQKIEIVAKKNKKNQWLVISVWSKANNLISKKPKSLINNLLNILLKRFLK